MVAFYLLLYPPQKWRRHFAAAIFLCNNVYRDAAFFTGMQCYKPNVAFLYQTKRPSIHIAPKAKIFLCNMLFMKQSWLCVYETTDIICF